MYYAVKNKKDFRIIKKLDFTSFLIETRYPSDFALPDYIRDERGNFLQKTLDLAVREDWNFFIDCAEQKTNI